MSDTRPDPVVTGPGTRPTPAAAPSVGPAPPSVGPAAAPSVGPAAAPSVGPALAPSVGPAAAPSVGPAAAPAVGFTRRKPLDPTVVEASRQLRVAQAAFQDDLDALSEATRSAMDIPAKIRKAPVKSAALAGGAGFLLLGGPRRVARAVISKAVPKRKRDPYVGLLPDEVERVLRDSGAADLPGVREALAHDFAEYLRTKGKVERRAPNAATSLWRTYDSVVGPLGTVAARLLVERLFAADRQRPRQG